MDPYDFVRERSNGLPDDATSKRMLNNRDWAPPGGTSHTEYQRLNDSIDRSFREALAAMVARTPGLSGGNLDTFGSDLVWLQWDADANGGYWVGCGIEHRGCWPPEALRTHMTVTYLTEDTSHREEALALYLTGSSCRNGRVLAAMVIEAVREHIESLGNARAASPE